MGTDPTDGSQCMISATFYFSRFPRGDRSAGRSSNGASMRFVVSLRLGESDGTSGGADSNRWHVLRGLSSLGHIDLHFGDTGIQIVVGPPTLALLPTLRSHRAILCGARSPRTIKSLVQSAIDADAEPIVSSQVCTSDFATSRFEIRADNLDSIRAIAENAGIVLMEMPPARTIAHGSTSLFDYERNLMWSTEPEVDWYREDFDFREMAFHANHRKHAQISS